MKVAIEQFAIVTFELPLNAVALPFFVLVTLIVCFAVKVALASFRHEYGYGPSVPL